MTQSLIALMASDTEANIFVITICFIVAAIIATDQYLIKERESRENEKRIINIRTKFESGTSSSRTARPSHIATKYWDKYKSLSPTKANAIQKIWGEDFSSLSDKDVKEKIASVEKLSERFNCEFSRLKYEYLKGISKYPDELIPNMLEITKKEMQLEAAHRNIATNNSIGSILIKWLQEKNETVNAIKRQKEETLKFYEAAKMYFPNEDEPNLHELAKSLREMSYLFKCSPDKLKHYYTKDIYAKYDGEYEHFWQIEDAIEHMIPKVTEIAIKTSMKPLNTMYGILFRWLCDIQDLEREKFVNTHQARCYICGSHDIELSLFKDKFICKSCGEQF